MGSILRATQHHELAHSDVQPGQIGHNTAVGDQYQGLAATVGIDGFLRLGQPAPAKLGVVERALQDIPGLRLTEGQPRGVQTSAARAREDLPDGDGVLAKGLADSRGLSPAGRSSRARAADVWTPR